MLDVDTRLFVNTHLGDQERVLHQATVTEVTDDLLVVRPEEPALGLEAGQKIEMLYERTRRFVKQEARVEEVLAESEPPAFRIQPTGEPESVEQREHYRVVTLMEGLSLVLCDETVELADVSASGFSVIAKNAHEHAKTLQAVIEHGGTTYSGRTFVQSIKTLPDGKIRYGLLCRVDEASLRKGLQSISMDIQRRQLRRRSAA